MAESDKTFAGLKCISNSFLTPMYFFIKIVAISNSFTPQEVKHEAMQEVKHEPMQEVKHEAMQEVKHEAMQEVKHEAMQEVKHEAMQEDNKSMKLVKCCNKKDDWIHCTYHLR